MQNSSSLKQEFLRKWITGLRKYNSQKKNMSLLERKKAIKVSADLAMASTRVNKTTLWRKVLIANTSTNNILTDQKVTKNFTNSSYRKIKIRSKKMLRRNHHGAKERVAASVIAKRLVKKRTRKLKSLLPGGEFMDDVSLVDETLDYIQSLRAQVEVMRCFVTASELIINPS